MAKISAYQKLKAENLQLKRDIASILGKNGFIKEQETKMKWETKFDLEKIVWTSTPIVTNQH